MENAIQPAITRHHGKLNGCGVALSFMYRSPTTHTTVSTRHAKKAHMASVFAHGGGGTTAAFDPVAGAAVDGLGLGYGVAAPTTVTECFDAPLSGVTLGLPGAGDGFGIAAPAVVVDVPAAEELAPRIAASALK